MNTNLANKEIQHLESQIAALEQLLEVYEGTVLEQSDKLYKEITERKQAEEKLNNALKERDASMNNLKYLMEFSTTMRDETQEKVLVTNMTKALKRQFNPDVLAVLFIDNETKMLDIPVIDPPIPIEKFINDEIILNPLLCRAINTGQEVYTKDVNEGICCTCIRNRIDKGDSFCIPMTGGGSTFGVVIMIKTETGYWDIEQYKLMLGYIEIATSSFTRARLFELTRRASITDPLTGIYNRRFFDEMLEKQLILAKRHNQKVSLLILDLDHFKDFNDTYGHIAGDRILQKLTKSIREIIRSSDTLARYGGEEFGIIMSSTDIMEALNKAEMICSHVRSICFDNIVSGQSLKITVSIGVASFPEYGADFDSLLGAADNALYKAKKLGRDRVEKL